MQKYAVNQHLIENLLSWVSSGEIAIPEIQRPFVWDSTKVRDLMDSLYKGYPVGYIIAWRNPNVRLKDGSVSEGKKILIDGQQRVTALTAAILGQGVISKDYRKIRITIAFHPVRETFEVLNPAIQKDTSWIHDIAPVINGEERVSRIVRQYCTNNPNASEEAVEDSIEKLKSIVKKQVGLIELSGELDIETVTEIFIRINSKGVVLSQADFAMSKIASNESYGGNMLRKCIDYFCHLAVAPEFYEHIRENDTEFVHSEYFSKISWLHRENDDLYDPSYSDLLRVAFTSEFGRGKLSDLVSLLSGRNFEKKSFEEDIARESFEKLKTGVLSFANQTNFQRFVMIVKSAGFIDPGMIKSDNALNFAYIIYLRLKRDGETQERLQTAVKKWLVFSLLTSRYAGSSESTFDLDIRQISERGFWEYLLDLEAAQLSDAFWNAGLVQQLNSSSTANPAFNVYLAAQCKYNTKGFLSKDITIRDMISHRGDIHHLSPKDYLKRSNLTRGQYNQVANYVYTESNINIRISNKSPKFYFRELLEQCDTGVCQYGGITDLAVLEQNLRDNDIPESIFDLEIEQYHDFLEERRKLIAQRLKGYYWSL